MITNDIIAEYVEITYKYAVKNTYSRDEADELTQEILFAAIRELPKLRDKNKFEPWFWGIAKNLTKSFRRNMGKQRAMYSYDKSTCFLMSKNILTVKKRYSTI